MALFTGHTITPDSALGGTQIQRSLRFAGAAFNNISRTPSSTGNQKVWTWSCWFKRTKLGNGSYNYLVSSYGNNDGIAAIYFDSDDRINTYFDTSGSNPYGAVNERRYRDVCAWMHIVWQVDAINGTQKIWINNVEESLSSSLNPPNFSYTMNQSGQLQTIGGAAWYPDGTGNNNYLTEIHFSDGNKYTPSDFGFTDAQTGQWRPKNGNVIKSNITYGTNGYWLDFRDNTSTTTLGYDYSGNGNHWTLNNMSVAAGADNDSLEDTATNNFCTLNPLRRFTDNCTLSDGNLKATGSGSYPGAAADIELTSGKWYYEFQITSKTSNPICGVCQNNYVSGGAGRIMYRADGVYIKSDGSEPSDPASFDVGDIIGVAIDLDHGDGLIRFYKNGSLQPVVSGLNSVKSNLSMSTLGGLLPYIQMYSSDVCVVNFGQRPFNHTPPTGHRSLNSKNLATVNAAKVVKPQRFFDIVLYTGNGSTGQSITSLEFQPDLVWCKTRSDNRNHVVTDSVRGRAKGLYPDADNTEFTDDAGKGLVSFDVNGFTVGEPQNASSHNKNGETIVAWCWKAGGNSSTYNIDGTGYGTASAAGLDGGSINPTGASVNTESGFGIYTYTGTGSNATIAHGLGRKPAWIIVKNRNATSGSTENWTVYHQGNTDNPETEYLTINGTSATSDLNTIWNDTEPTSTLISIGSHARVNESASVNYLMYVWSEIRGFSKFGSYIGNGNSDGAFVHCGFRPAWVVIKKTSGTSNWNQRDTARDPDNPTGDYIIFNSNEAQGTSSSKWDILSNGFKHYNTSGAFNESGSTYIYMAFAERPSGTGFGLDANAR